MKKSYLHPVMIQTLTTGSYHKICFKVLLTYDVFVLPTMVIDDINQQVIYNKEGIILAEDIIKIINSKEK